MEEMILEKRKVEITIECKAVGLDETLEKLERLVEFLRQVDSHKDLIGMDSKTLVQAICGKDREAQEQSCN